MRAELSAITVAPGSTILDAMRAIDSLGYEIALVVDHHDRLLGVVTDGDVRRAILEGAQLTDPVTRCVERSPVTVEHGTDRAQVLDLMRARTVSQIPVVDADGRLLGLHLLREFVAPEVRSNWAVVMAGGRGRRLGELTRDTPKPMMKVAGRPILERIVLHLVGHGIRQVVITVNYLADHIVDHFGDGSQFGCNIDYVIEEEPLGTAGALALMPSRVGRPPSPFVVMNGDLVSNVDLSALLDTHVSSGARATVAIRPYRHEVPFGVIGTDQRGRLTALREKPTTEWPVNAGVYVFDPDVIDLVPPATFHHVTELLHGCLERGDVVGTWLMHDDWLDVGRPAELARARGQEPVEL